MRKLYLVILVIVISGFTFAQQPAPAKPAAPAAAPAATQAAKPAMAPSAVTKSKPERYQKMAQSFQKRANHMLKQAQKLETKGNAAEAAHLKKLSELFKAVSGEYQALALTAK